MKDNTKIKAPKVPIPPRDKPFLYAKEYDDAPKRKSPQSPMNKKRLSK